VDGVDLLLAERDIRNVVLRYCRGVDRMDRDLVRSCYHDGATDSHGSFEGDVEGFIDWVWRVLQRYDMTMHLIGNVLVEVDGDDPDRARCESYGIAFHRTENGAAEGNLTTGFRYVDRFARRPVAPGGTPEWRIERRVAVTEWARADRPEGHWPIPAGMLRGRRDGTDPVQEGRAQEGKP
jgi:hypothetical protein